MSAPWETWRPTFAKRLNAVLDDAQTDAVLDILQPQLAGWAEYENAVNWYTDCLSCANILSTCIKETARADQAEKELADYEENVIGDMNEKAIDNARRIAALELQVREGRRAIARIRSLHSRYRSALTDEFDCCAHCNQLTANLIPYPCETLLALGEADVQLASVYDSCPGVELKPNPCRCPCYGCRHSCGAHNPALDEEGDVR